MCVCVCVFVCGFVTTGYLTSAYHWSMIRITRRVVFVLYKRLTH